MNIKSNALKILALVLTASCIVLVFIFVNNKGEKVEKEDKTEPVNQVEEEITSETITFSSIDGLDITADLYKINETAPIILLFHRADWSRGEYKEIAPKLNDLGYNAMAVDARSGNKFGASLNLTAKRAKEKGLGTKYADAAIDIEASIQYAIDELGYDNIITWGSSYSCMLAMSESQKYSDNVKAVITFSPGGYFRLEDKNIMDYGNELTIPIFITSAKTEAIVSEAVFESIATEDKVLFIPESKGSHGSRVLWGSSKGNEEYWNALESFLASLK